MCPKGQVSKFLKYSKDKMDERVMVYPTWPRGSAGLGHGEGGD